MNILTKRLNLTPLTYQQLLDYLKLDYSLEKGLNLALEKRTIAPPLAAAFANRILPNVQNPNKNYLFFTLWAIIDVAKNTMVGELCFKGEPYKNGEIEIGYGTYDVFQNNGYMTEAVGAIATWALAQNGVKTIIAKTDFTNIASQKILAKNNFIKVDEKQMIEWHLTKNK